MAWTHKSSLVILSILFSLAIGLSASASNLVNLPSSQVTSGPVRQQLPVKDLSYCAPLKDSMDQALTKITKDNASLFTALVANYQTMLELWKNTDCSQLGTQPVELNAQQKKTDLCNQVHADYQQTLGYLSTGFQHCYGYIGNFGSYYPLCDDLKEEVSKCMALGCGSCPPEGFLTDCSISGYNHVLSAQNLSCAPVQCNL